MAERVIALLQQFIAQEGTKRAVAKRVGRSRQWLDSTLQGSAAGAPVLLRIARQEGLNRLELLRAEGHGELADELAAAGLDGPLVSTDDQALLAALRTLTKDQQAHFRALVLSFARTAIETPASAPAKPEPVPSKPRKSKRRR